MHRALKESKPQASLTKALRSPSKPLDAPVRSWAEGRFGVSLDRLRIHDNAEAAETARAHHAQALTVGGHVVFGQNEHRPHTPAGRALLGHEIAHAVQQSFGSSQHGSAASPVHEQQADRAARGGAEQLSAGTVRAGSIQRAEAGTYVSTVNAGAQPGGADTFLDMAEGYYRYWGHPNVRRVGTMQEVLSNLASRSGTDPFEKIRLVGHASAIDTFLLGSLREAGPDTVTLNNVFFDASTAGMTTAANFRDFVMNDAGAQIMGSAANTAGAFDALQGAAAVDTPLAAFMASIGVAPRATGGFDLANSNAAVTAFLGAVTDAGVLAYTRAELARLHPPARGRRLDPLGHEAAIRAFITLRADTFLPELLANLTGRPRRTAERHARDLLSGAAARGAALPAGTAGMNVVASQTDADDLGNGLEDPSAAGLRRDWRAALRVYSGATPYLRDLQTVRDRVDPSTEIEIRGCQIGRDTNWMRSMRAFFGGAAGLPAISAPDLFQYFAQGFPWSEYDVAAPHVSGNAAEPDLQTQWGAGLEANFNLWQQVRQGQRVLVPWSMTWAELVAEYTRAPVLRLAARGLTAATLPFLNPQLAGVTGNLLEGTNVWLSARPFSTAGYSTLDDFARSFLNDANAWRRILDANPAIVQRVRGTRAAPSGPDPYADLDPAAIQFLPSEVVWTVDLATRNAAGTMTAAAGSTVVNTDFTTQTFQDFLNMLQSDQPFVRGPGPSGTDLQYMYTAAGRAASSMENFVRTEATSAGEIAAGGALPRAFRRGNAGARGRDTYLMYLSANHPPAQDPIYPTDPRYPAHIRRIP
jgi:hypothetical protein